MAAVGGQAHRRGGGRFEMGRRWRRRWRAGGQTHGDGSENGVVSSHMFAWGNVKPLGDQDILLKLKYSVKCTIPHMTLALWTVWSDETRAFCDDLCTSGSV